MKLPKGRTFKIRIILARWDNGLASAADTELALYELNCVVPAGALLRAKEAGTPLIVYDRTRNTHYHYDGRLMEG